MTPRTPWFPSLSAEAPLADAQMRQTLALGLVSLGIAVLLMAAGAPNQPSAGLLAGAGLAVAAMAVLMRLWRKSGRRHLPGYSTTHFLVRYLFIILCPALLWLVFGDLILELAGLFPPILFGLLLLVYPVSRILHEKVGQNPLAAPHTEMAYLICRQLEMVLGVFAVIGLLSGAILDANRDYPTDPTPLLLMLWLLALMAVLAGVVLGVAHWTRLFRRPVPPQALDDAPAEKPAQSAARFDSDRF